MSSNAGRLGVGPIRYRLLLGPVRFKKPLRSPYAMVARATWPKGISGRRDSRRLRYRSRLTHLTSRRGLGNFHEFSRFHIVDIAVYRNVIGNQRVVANTHDILDDALGVVREC
jgi:hypothetical protein